MSRKISSSAVHIVLRALREAFPSPHGIEDERTSRHDAKLLEAAGRIQLIPWAPKGTANGAVMKAHIGIELEKLRRSLALIEPRVKAVRKKTKLRRVA